MKDIPIKNVYNIFLFKNCFTKQPKLFTIRQPCLGSPVISNQIKACVIFKFDWNNLVQWKWNVQLTLDNPTLCCPTPPLSDSCLRELSTKTRISPENTLDSRTSSIIRHDLWARHVSDYRELIVIANEELSRSTFINSKKKVTILW